MMTTQSISGRLRKILIHPPGRIQNPERASKLQLVAGFSLVFIVLQAVLAFMLWQAPAPLIPHAVGIVTAFILLVVAYVLSRLGHYNLSAVALVLGLFSGSALASPAPTSAPERSLFMPVPM